MYHRLAAVLLCIAALGACQESVTDSRGPLGPGSQGLSQAAPAAGVSGATSSPAVAGADRPWKASLIWTVAGIQWAGVPGQATSLFDGRCSVLSDYVISATFVGEATHAGHVSGSTEHCSQILWSPQGPVGSTYSDGRGLLRSANSSTLVLRYGPGETGVDAESGEIWFRDPFTFEGGTGLFLDATGGGQEGGRFTDFNALLSGTPVPMWMQGTIAYRPGQVH